MIFNLTGPITGDSITAPIIGTDFTWTGGDGTYQVLDDGNGNWRIKFFSSGTFTPLKNMNIDAFLVGGGGGSGRSYCGGGGSGYTTTLRSIILSANTTYSIVIGAGGVSPASGAGTAGGQTTAFNGTALGGAGTSSGSKTSIKPGGSGGSGGGGGSTASNGMAKATGGTDGSNGTDSASTGGIGQGTTTREFGETTGDLYASGAGNNITSTIANSGNGGKYLTDAAEGIVIIRQHKEANS